MIMRSSCQPNCKGIDTSVGGLVWVRRRNGSWWPGRVMGLDELPETLLVSQRLGTPVKLLGREDASVDWYNLEKSKRVKAFRCGEYDECIEKAKASASHSNKKAVKYARREDAILHALELESADEVNDHWRFEGNATQDLSPYVLSCEKPNPTCTSDVQFIKKKRRKTPNDSEDDGTEGTKRMKGLEDLGLRVVSKQKQNMRFQNERLLELVLPDNGSLSESNICNSLSSDSPVNSSKGSCSSLKRSSHVAHVYESFKRKNRRRPLTKVLESTSPGRSSLQGAQESKASALESIESKKTDFSVVINNNSDCSGTSCEKETSLNASEHTCDAAVDATHSLFHPESKEYKFSGLPDFPDNDFSDGFLDIPFSCEENQTEDISPVFTSSGSRKLRSGTAGRQSNSCNQVGSIPLKNEGLDETGSTSFAAHVNYAKLRLEKGTSKWQLKGRRNSRCLSKNTSRGLGLSKFVEAADQSNDCLMDSQDVGRSFVGCDGKTDKNSFGKSLISYNGGQLEKCRQVSEDLLDNSLQWNNQICEKLVTGKSTTRARTRDSFFSGVVPVCPVPIQRSHHQSPLSTYMDAPNKSTYRGSSLYDVNLDVRASYQGQHVPLVSLMSKLNGKAIIGHPIAVEALEDGNDSLLLAASSDMNGTFQDDTPYATRSLRGTQKNPSNHLTVHSRLSKKKLRKIRKFSLFSKKTRKLSSLIVEHIHKKEERKPELKFGEPVIACVPLKLVFSRINEALNCPSRPAHRILTSGNP
ncbi:uncharacterized protein At1g51745-like [Tasmannia lanceolata]|uniref:uncharacterized protein At1g51745-like n=1 Tax=Tasmannia lanceolata TaxID=3420 RepID=UPI0040645832